MLDDKDVFVSYEAERWLRACNANANLVMQFSWWGLKEHAKWLIRNSWKIDILLIERGLLPHA